MVGPRGNTADGLPAFLPPTKPVGHRPAVTLGGDLDLAVELPVGHRGVAADPQRNAQRELVERTGDTLPAVDRPVQQFLGCLRPLPLARLDP